MKRNLVLVLVLLGLFASCRVSKSENQSKDKAVSVVETEKGLSITINGVPFNMIKVEGGTMTLGTTLEQEGPAFEHMNEPHRVTLPTFYIGETEVTQDLWEMVMGYNYSKIKGAKYPVERVNWYECVMFCDRLSRMTGMRFRLPLLDEWEFAARGGMKSKGFKYSGSNNIDEVAWYEDNSKGKGKSLVAQKKPNELGIYDMCGNVSEWIGECTYADLYDEYGVLKSGLFHIHEPYKRGGNWDGYPEVLRVSQLSYGLAYGGGELQGLRIVLEK